MEPLHHLHRWGGETWISTHGADTASGKKTENVQAGGEGGRTRPGLAWLGRFLVPGLFDGEHHLRIERSDSGCLFVQEERFRGALTSLYGKGLEATRRGFEEMNIALKSRVESRA